MKVAIIDDETSYSKTLLQKLDTLKKQYDLNISTFYSGTKFLEDGKCYDIVFMDIEMPGIDGIQTIKKYREYDQNGLIIFLTNHLELCQEGYLVNAFRFLHKNDKEEKFEEAVKSAITIMTGRKKIVITVANGKQIILDHSEITYIEAYKRGIKVYTKEQIIVAVDKISSIANELKESCFYQTHRAFIINLNDLLFYEKKDIYLKRGIAVPLSEKKVREFQKVYFDWKFQNGNG